MQKSLTIGLVTAALAAGALSLVKVDGGSPAPAAVIGEAVAAEEPPVPTVVRMAQLAVSQPYMFDYERGPRIIQVPQRGDSANERTVVRPVSRPAPHASVERRPEPAVIEDDDDEGEVHVSPAPAPKPRPRAVTSKPRAAAVSPEPPLPPQPPAATTPRWKLRSEAPPPTGPRRAVLSAPPSSLGPTPLRPTPKFDNKAADRGEKLSGEKFSAPREPAPPPVTVTESQPPLGYSPPATAMTPATPVPPAPLPEETSADVTAAAPAAEPSPEN